MVSADKNSATSWRTKVQEIGVQEIGVQEIRESLVDFADLQVLINGENGVANRRVWRSWGVMSDNGKIGAVAAFDFVGVAVALSASEIHAPRRSEVAEGPAVAVGSDVGALGLRDLHQVHAHTGQADRLRGRCSGVRS